MGRMPTNRCEWLEILPEGSIGAELGVARGDFSKRMLQVVKPKRLYLVDAWRQQVSGTVMDCVRTDDIHEKRYQQVLRKVKRFRGDTDVRILRMQTIAAASRVADGELDWLYIDADHSFDGVYGDLCAWYPKVTSGGIIAGHDFLPTYRGQRATLRELDRMKEMQDDGRGVMGAVGCFATERGITPLHHTDERCPSFWFTRP